MLVVAAVLAVTASSWGQSARPSITDPVTRSEAGAVLAKVENAVAKVLGVRPSTRPRLQGAQAVTREQIIDEFEAIFRLAEPKFKYTPDPFPFEAGVLRAQGASRDKLVRLIEHGAVAPRGPVAAGPRNTFTLQEFGDAVGYLVVAISSLTHTPDSRWSPYLMPDFPDDLDPNRRNQQRSTGGATRTTGGG